ncbi:MAG: ferredoxin--NADP reductase [Ignavibacteriae bacterium]|nr:ferredoxin--NADP reductase [Ignavibacteriota bacterium]
MENSPYNATVTGKILITPDLMVLRIRTDDPRDTFNAGQFTAIGLLASEQRSPNSVFIEENLKPESLIKRPYSIASANHETQDFEFYISQVKSGTLTPRLFNLTQGNRIWIDKRIIGFFNLAQTPSVCNIVMIATGTGLAPYISFLRSHLKDHKETKLVVIHGAAYLWDLGYRSELEFIDYNFDNFYYYPTLLQADDSWKGLRGYIEKHLEAQILENIGIEINPEKTHFFLCGNPKMIASVSEYLFKRNYTKHSKKFPGSLHIEEY